MTTPSYFTLILEEQRKAYHDSVNILFTSLNNWVDEQNITILQLPHSFEYTQEKLRTFMLDHETKNTRLILIAKENESLQATSTPNVSSLVNVFSHLPTIFEMHK